MPERHQKTNRIFIFMLPLVVAILIMLPRLVSPQFGLLDDGAMLDNVRQILSGDFSMQHDVQAGRFRPLYWAYFTLIYILAGPSPFWYFFGHTILFLILVIEIWFLIKQMGGEPWQGLLACLIFIFSMPIVENFYTLSKGEPLQMVFLLFGLINFNKLRQSPKNPSRIKSSITKFFSILAAMLVKETTMVIIPIAVLWTGMNFLYNRKKPNNLKYHYFWFLGSVILAIAAALFLRTIWSGPSLVEGTYTTKYELSVSSLIAKTARWLTLYAFYFHYLLPLSLVGLIAFLQDKRQITKKRHELIYWLLWVVIWIFALIPWEFTEVYYLLPFSIGGALLTGLSAPNIGNSLKNKNCLPWIQKALLALSITLLIMTFPNYYTHARTQLTIDKTNQRMLESFESFIPENGDAFIGMDAENEYVMNTERFLRNRYGRDDINYDFVSLKTLGGLHHFSQGILVLPYIRNQPDLIVRIGMQEKFTIAWRENIISVMDDRLTKLDEIRGTFKMINFNLPILVCPVLGNRGFCEEADPILILVNFAMDGRYTASDEIKTKPKNFCCRPHL